MLIKQRISPTDYDRFIAFNQQHGGAPVRRTYLEGARLYALSRPEYPEEWVCIYVINTRAHFRCLSLIPAALRADVLARHGLTESHIAEIALLCRDESKGWQPGEREAFYNHAVLDALLTGRKHIIGATVDARKLATQMIVLSEVLHEGEVDCFGTPQYGWVIYASWWRAVTNAVRYLLKRRPAKSDKHTPQPTAKTPLKKPTVE